MQDQSYQALIYTKSRSIAALAAKAFAELPLNWVWLDSPKLTREQLARHRFDFVLVDLDSEWGKAIFVDAEGSIRQKGILFGVTNLKTDPEILDISLRSTIFYPIRHTSLGEDLQQAFSLAHLGLRAHPDSTTTLDGTEPSIRVLADVAGTPGNESEFSPTTLLHFLARHSLSIVWQERIASGISAFGSIWYVHEITKDISKFDFLLPSRGPLELIALSLLLWLCAKHRRVVAQQSSSQLQVAETA